MTTEQGCLAASKATGEHVNLACMWFWNLVCLSAICYEASMYHF